MQSGDIWDGTRSFLFFTIDLAAQEAATMSDGEIAARGCTHPPTHPPQHTRQQYSTEPSRCPEVCCSFPEPPLDFNLPRIPVDSVLTVIERSSGHVIAKMYQGGNCILALGLDVDHFPRRSLRDVTQPLRLRRACFSVL